MKYKRVLICLMLFLISFLLIFVGLGFNNKVNALSGSPTEAIGQEEIKLDTTVNNSGLGKALKNLIVYLQIAGTGISIIVVTILGIKYMTASVEAKAEVKKEMMPVLIGMGLLFGAVNLIAIATDIIGNIFG